jgi:hypothetical protein
VRGVEAEVFLFGRGIDKNGNRITANSFEAFFED